MVLWVYTMHHVRWPWDQIVGKEGCSNTKNEEVGQTQNYWLPPPNRNANIPEHPTTIHGASSRKVAYHPNTAWFTPTIHRQVTASERYTLVKRITLRTTCSTYVGAPRIQIQHLTLNWIEKNLVTIKWKIKLHASREKFWANFLGLQ